MDSETNIVVDEVAQVAMSILQSFLRRRREEGDEGIPAHRPRLDDEFDFLEQERAAFSRRLDGIVSRRSSRRVTLTTISVEVTAPATSSFATLNAPPRYRLQRQNAFISNIENIPSKQVTYVLSPAEVDEDAWECAICQEDEKVGIVWHPCNCHMFHEGCLQESMVHNKSCPLCRRFPQNLVIKDP